MQEFREFTETLERRQQVLAGLQAEVSGANEQTGKLEHLLRELDRELSRSEDGLHIRKVASPTPDSKSRASMQPSP
ncbi:MAG: hypothetical protein U0792_07675 [Gemmataceae bacterium]